MATMTYRDAMSLAMREDLKKDERVFIIGQDIGPYGGTYAVTKGFWDEFGPKRIKDSPLSESAIVGAALGAAMAGLRPIVEIMTINFTLLALDQIVNHASKIRSMSGGQFSIPMMMRTVTGGGASLAATHSQSFEPWYASIPGIKVVVPATPKDALGLYRAARREMDPVVFIEHVLLYGTRGEVPDGDFDVPLGKADVKREGKDLTIVAYSRAVLTALQAAAELSKRGVEAEVIDLRCLRPLDMETVLASVKKTHKAVVVEEAYRTGGFGGEIAAQIQENAFDYLDAPIGRVGGEEVPIPYSRWLEPLAIPDAAKVLKTVEQVLGL